jgi:methanogenic corrinoid protein MtbC1
MTATAGEQHRFGVAMVAKFLQAAGWSVRSEPGATAEALATVVQNEWFAVAGLTLSREAKLDQLATAIKKIRQYSCNPSIGVMVGGPAFAGHPEFAIRVGADAAAVNAPTAVLLAQKLFDLGAAKRVKASAS